MAPENNSEEKGLIVIANEVSATISVYTLDNVTLSTKNFNEKVSKFVIYPNPAKTDKVFFAEPTSYSLFDIQGRKIKEATNAAYINISALNQGTYIVRNQLGQVQKLIIE
ncbi:T9SS type A sorting domain-containing protein [Mesonia maritima]|uniref:T9SS type A sorting domain-containing protein n=1 Tax=Mesonia maritima TaxID=1793873 RepID=UPI0036287A67